MDRSWSKEQIDDHKEAARLVDLVMGEAFDFIGRNNTGVSEWGVQQFVLERFGHYGLKTDGKLVPIVAFGVNTSNVHYFPSEESSIELEENSLIMMDIWARLDKKEAPFADITWMGFYGDKVPDMMQREVDLVFEARDVAIDFAGKVLKSGMLPVGSEIDQAAREYLKQNNRAEYFLHGLGHVLGLFSPHGVTAGLRRTNHRPILLNTGYTIEPGIYFENKFGVRSEINFYVNEKMEMVVTTKVQKELVMV